MIDTGDIDVFLGLDVGNGEHHATAVTLAGKKAFDKRLPNTEPKLRELFARLQATHGTVLVVVDQPASIGALPLAVARDMGCPVAYLPGLTMRRIADLYPGEAKTDAKDAFIIADAARVMPHTLRAINGEDETIAELEMIVGFDDDLAGEATRVANRPHGLLTRKTCATAWDGLELRADENHHSVASRPNHDQRSSGWGATRPPYTGPQLTVSPRIYAVLEPVHWLLAQASNPFVERKIAREVGRQLHTGMEAARLQHRLRFRFATVLESEIRDPGRWLLGVALPRWGCGHLDCESGVRWSNGERCAVCQEVVADKVVARRRAQRIEQGLCPDHNRKPGPAGGCRDCEIQQAIDGTVAAPRAPHPLQGPPRGYAASAGAGSS